VKAYLAKFDEHQGCYPTKEESKMLITLGTQKKLQKEGIKVQNVSLC